MAKRKKICRKCGHAGGDLKFGSGHFSRKCVSAPRWGLTGLVFTIADATVVVVVTTRPGQEQVLASLGARVRDMVGDAA
ncbi:MAG: hypothetical protein ACRDO0_09805 [Nocardioidaceae bacterium]